MESASGKPIMLAMPPPIVTIIDDVYIAGCITTTKHTINNDCRTRNKPISVPNPVSPAFVYQIVSDKISLC